MGWCAAWTLAACSGSGGSSGGGTLRVLQMNLCDSGIARCYTGRSVAEAARTIRSTRPDVVTLNEVCRGDVAALSRALPGVVLREFRAVEQPSGHRPVQCRNGEDYGVGLLTGVRSPHLWYTVSSGRYPAQDASDTEARVWLCLHLPGRYDVCTTHLASTSPTVALQQCRYLVGTVVPSLLRRTGGEPVVVGADLNLRDAPPPNVQSCVPRGLARAGDGGRQDVLAEGMGVTGHTTIDLHGTTDHPGLLVDLHASGAPASK